MEAQARPKNLLLCTGSVHKNSDCFMTARKILIHSIFMNHWHRVMGVSDFLQP